MNTAPPINIAGDTLSVRFDHFDIAAYRLFLKVKRIPEFSVDFDEDTASYTVSAPARFAPMLGIPQPIAESGDLPFADFLFDDQREVVKLALAAKRFADWKGTGLGKTLDLLEWSRHVIHRTGGRVLIVTLNNLIQQTMNECSHFYGGLLTMVRIENREAMKEFCAQGTIDGLAVPRLGIVNYEKFNPVKGVDTQVINEVRQLSGIVLDESSRLCQSGGKQKWAIIKSTKGIPYKLSCTATPAPNDTMEFASQASFLERMRSEGEIIWTYFTRNSKTHRWSVKKHARKAFFEFMASWSIYVRDPRHYGWRLNMPDLPPYETIRHTLAPTQQQIQFAAELTAEPTGQLHMFVDKATNTIERAKLSQIARGFRYVKDASGKKTRELIESVKPGYIADLVRSEVRSGHQVLVWTIFDAESDLILDRLQGLDGVEALTGRVPKSKRDPILERFRRGESPVLVSRAVMLGFGLNFQNCSSMVFSGWNDSFVAWYQAIRRAWRYGQNKTLRVHIPVIPELEGDMLENIFSKEDRHESDIREMEDNYISALHEISRTKEAEAAA